ncbi:hypothetical protein QTP88_013840 [Uroleucon formosanum]
MTLFQPSDHRNEDRWACLTKGPVANQKPEYIVFVPHRLQSTDTTVTHYERITMGGRRAGSKRNWTPLVTESKKLRNQSFSPPPLQVGTTQRQRAEPLSSDPSDSESLSGDSYVPGTLMRLSTVLARPLNCC